MQEKFWLLKRKINFYTSIPPCHKFMKCALFNLFFFFSLRDGRCHCSGWYDERRRKTSQGSAGEIWWNAQKCWCKHQNLIHKIFFSLNHVNNIVLLHVSMTVMMKKKTKFFPEGKNLFFVLSVEKENPNWDFDALTSISEHVGVPADASEHVGALADASECVGVPTDTSECFNSLWSLFSIRHWINSWEYFC